MNPDGTDNLILGNIIGEDSSGNPVANNYDGIFISGSNTDVSENTIAHNGIYGIRMNGNDNIISLNEIYQNYTGVVIFTGSGNTISQNSIYDNSFIGIDLQVLICPTCSFDFGVTLNDSGDVDSGANTLLNYPEFTSVSISLVEGTACNGCTVEIFLPDGDPSGHGEGLAFIASGVTGGGIFSIPILPGTVSGCQEFTATATDLSGNTSEFAPNTPPTGIACLATKLFVPTIIILIPGVVAGGWVYRRRRKPTGAVGGFLGGAFVGVLILVLGNVVFGEKPAEPLEPDRESIPLIEELEPFTDTPIPSDTPVLATAVTEISPAIASSQTPTQTPSPTNAINPTFTPTPPPTIGINPTFTATYTPLPIPTETSVPDSTGPSVSAVSDSPDPVNLEGTKPDTIAVSATVTDPSGVGSVTLYYRLSGGSLNTILMTHIGGGIYQFTVGPFKTAGLYQYYILAVDTLANANCSSGDLSACPGGTFLVNIP